VSGGRVEDATGSAPCGGAEPGRVLGGGADAAEGKFEEQGALVDFLEEAGAEGVGNLEDCGENAVGEGVAVAVVVFIGVHG